MHNEKINQLLTKTNLNSLLVFDLDKLEENVSLLNQAFPTFKHHFAVKANPLVSILEFLVSKEMGMEAASFSEILLAKHAKAESIVFDSPVKTDEEIVFCLKNKIILNADSISEVEHITKLGGAARVGLRINPLVSDGKISATSVGSKGSRFGIPIDRENEIIETYAQNACLDGIHCHVGSQGVLLDQLVQAMTKLKGIVEKIELKTKKKLWIDIGGGLPAKYRPTDNPPTFKEYALALKKENEWLFSGREVYTEFGRKIIADCAKAYAKVEWVKTSHDGQDLSIHLGADFILRRAYRPQDWFHSLRLLAPNGVEVIGDHVATRVFGPLCFGGDVLDQEALFPQAKKGNWVEIDTVGAYTLSMWSRHCSRPIPTVYGFSKNNNEMIVLKKGETPEDLIQFWK